MKTSIRKPKTAPLNKVALILTGASVGIALTSLLTISVSSTKPLQVQNSPENTTPVIKTVSLREEVASPNTNTQVYAGSYTENSALLSQSRNNNSELPALQPLSDPTLISPFDIPTGFGLTTATEDVADAAPSSPKTDTSAKDGAQNETNQLADVPTSSNQTSTHNLDASTSKPIDEADPRELGVTANEGPNKEYEETLASVQRTLTAVSPSGEKQLIRLKIPVMYQSRTLRLTKDNITGSQSTLAKLKTKHAELKTFREDIEAILQEWNKIVENTTPNQLLLPESPTLPNNQSKAELNRTALPELIPGKNISYETH